MPGKQAGIGTTAFYTVASTVVKYSFQDFALNVNGWYTLERVEIRLDSASGDGSGSNLGSRDAGIKFLRGTATHYSAPLDQFLPINLLEATGTCGDAAVTTYNAGAFEFGGWRQNIGFLFKDKMVVRLINYDPTYTTLLDQLTLIAHPAPVP